MSFKSIKKAANGHDAINGGLTLPREFQASIIADNLVSARHLVAAPQGDIYVHLAGTKNGKGILQLHLDGDKAAMKLAFENFGGTGIAIKNG